MISGRHGNKPLLYSWIKHGDQRHDFVVLELVEIDMLTSSEQRWIDDFKSKNWKLFNIAMAAGSMLGFKHSDATRDKISKIQIGRRASKETKEKMRKAHIGREYARGYKLTNEVLSRRSRKGKKLSESGRLSILAGQRKRIKTNKLIDPMGMLHIIFGINKFCEENNLSLSAMCQVINGKARHHKGWTLPETSKQLRLL